MKNINEFIIQKQNEVMTNEIQKAIDYCAEARETLYFSKGTYITGTLFLKSHTRIFLEEGAVILGSKNIEDYSLDIIGCVEAPSFNQCLLYANEEEDIQFIGNGTIDGGGKGFSGQMRPMLLRFVKCKDISISDIKVCSSMSWGCHFVQCNNLLINHISIDNWAQHNNDGVDLDSCYNVKITNCNFNTEDDSICLKSTTDSMCENIIVSNCMISSGTASIKFGTSSKTGFRNITITNCTFYDCPMGTIKLLMVDGGILENVTISNIVMDRVGSPLFIRLGNRNIRFNEPAEMDHSTKQMCKDKSVKGILQNIIIDNIIANVTVNEADRTPIMITGLPGMDIEHIILSNFIINFPGGLKELQSLNVEEDESRYPEQKYFGVLPAWGMFIRHVNDISLNQIKMYAKEDDVRSCFYQDDIKNLNISNSNLI